MAASLEDEDLIPYSVVYFSSESRSYLGSVKDKHEDYINEIGWVSAEYCSYPQEVVVHLLRKAVINRVQMLCHHIFTPTKVEILIGMLPPGESKVNLGRAKFESLGLAKFNDNQTSNYECRERKTVFINAQGHFLMFKLRHNHNSPVNPKNQVGLMSIKIFGLDLEKRRGRIGEPISISRPHGRISGRNPATQVKSMIKIFSSRKVEYANFSKYRQAKDLKEILVELKKAEGKLTKLAAEEKGALQEEDYDNAEKAQYQSLRIRDDLLDDMPEIQDYLTETEKRSLGLTEGGADSEEETAVEEKDSGVGKFCPFCGEENRRFSDKGLSLHYKSNCPMLLTCNFCRKVVEISRLHDHYWEKCAALKDQAKECPNCGVTGPEDEIRKHNTKTTCPGTPAPEASSWCPLCLKLVHPNSVSGWKTHLIGPTACVSNPRRSLNGIDYDKAEDSDLSDNEIRAK